MRRELKAKGDYEALRKLPRDSNPNRLKNRDRIDGRPHAYMQKFGMSRINFRNLAHEGKSQGSQKPAGNRSRKKKVFITKKADVVCFFS